MILSCVSDNGNGSKWVEWRDIQEVAVGRCGVWWDVGAESEKRVKGDMLVLAYGAGCNHAQLAGVHLLAYCNGHCIILHFILHFHRRFIYFCYKDNITR